MLQETQCILDIDFQLLWRHLEVNMYPPPPKKTPTPPLNLKQIEKITKC